MTYTPMDVPGTYAHIYPLVIEVESDAAVNYAYQQNGVPVIKTIHITNTSTHTLDDIRLVITADPLFARQYSTHISRIHQGTTINLHSVDITLIASFLAAQTERVKGSLLVQAYQQDMRVGGTSVSLDILAYNEWNGLQSLPEILTAYITPNHPAIERIHHQAGLLLNQWSPGSTISGYQTQKKSEVYLIASALYTAISNYSIVYSHAPASFERFGQQIRLPGRIMETRVGNCLDLTCLCAGCLEQAGLHSLIIITKGHSFCGVWLEEGSFADPVIDDLVTLRKRVELKEICVFECTALTSNPAISFDESVSMAESLLSDESAFRVVIDVHRTRTGIHRIHPISETILPYSTREPGTEEGEGETGGEEDEPEQIREHEYLPEIPDPFLKAGLHDYPLSDLEPSGSDKTSTGRLESWKRHLLDLSSKNPLLNFRESKNNLHILHPDLPSLEDALADGRTFRIFPLPERDLSGIYPDDAAVYTREFLREEFLAHRLYTPLPGKKLPDHLLHLYKTTRDSINENGVTTLYLALGFLSWYETTDAENPLLSPLVLIPLEMERRSYLEGFTFRQGDEDPRLNVTLLHRLNVDYGFSIPGLQTLPTDEHGIDVRSILLSFRHQIRDIPKWEILDKAVIGHFSFSKFLMWRDLEACGETLINHPLVACLNDPENSYYHTNDTFPDPGTLDAICSPSDLYLPLSADSSQQAAVRAAGLGSTFVLYGPPGTGKSQTITNIIAHCLAQSKTVLFVSEKKVALDVVHERLKTSGLGQFCLELHSNKSNKREVIRQFTQVANGNDTDSHDRWLLQTRQLSSVRSHLNAYVKALHERQITGESYFDGISRLCGLRDVPVLDFNLPACSDINAELLAHYRDCIRRVRLAGEQCGHPSQNVWNSVRGGPWSIGWKNNIHTLIKNLITDTSNLITTSSLISSHIGCTGTPKCEGAPLFAGDQSGTVSRSYLEFIISTLSVFEKVKPVPSTFLTAENPIGRISKLKTIIAAGKKRDTLREWIRPRYLTSILSGDIKKIELDALAIRNANPILRWFLLIRLKRSLQPFMVPGYIPDTNNLISDIQKIVAYKQKVIAIRRIRSGAEGMFGSLWQSGNPDWSELSEILSRVESVIGHAENLVEEDDEQTSEEICHLLSAWAPLLSPGYHSSFYDEFDDLSREYQSTFRLFSSRLDELVSVLGADPLLSFGSVDDSRYLKRVYNRLSLWNEHINDLHNWCFWCEVKEQAVSMGLSDLVRYYEMYPESSHSLSDLFDRRYLQKWTEYIRDTSDILKNFVQADFEDNIAYFKSLDDICMLVCRDEIKALLSLRLSGLDDETHRAEKAVLSHQMQLQRKHLPIRVFLTKIQTILPRLKPCMLMSPISVAQYLDPSLPPVDLVIFDEASQIPVWDAVGAIARGKKTIIVGDPKQLPPTNGFQRREDDETQTDFVELESVLDDCIAAGIPRLQLTWHYRSRHESLIAFSNYHFYTNELLTFPSPHQVSAVSLRNIGGVFDRGRTRTNRKEAEEVVTEVVRRLRDPVSSRDSVGIVTFNASQQDLILSLLEKARQDFPEIDEFFSDERQESVFVKNLENVQGDERDLILFSVGYGPDMQGKVSMNFGPLNRDGGERRLNVAITRARKEVVVFSSLRPDQIDLSQTQSQGVKLLKNFLLFARQGPSVIAETCLTGYPDGKTPLEEEIAARLIALGRTVHLHVGCSGYHVDVAVEDPDEPGRYLLGIECDGDNFKQSRTARDRFRLQDEVLKGLGWELHRVWSSDWWDNPDREIARIESAIMGAMVKRMSERSKNPDPFGEEEDDEESGKENIMIYDPDLDDEILMEDYDHEDSDPAAVSGPDGFIRSYIRYSNPVLLGTKECFYRDDANYDILSVLSDIVKTEGPVSQNQAMKKVIHHWGIRRLGPAITERIVSFYEKAGIIERDEGYGVFLWDSYAEPNSYIGFRVKQVFDPEPRRIEDIPPQEIGNAIRYVHQVNPDISGQELIRAVVRAFGMSRTGASGEAIIRSVLDKMPECSD